MLDLITELKFATQKTSWHCFRLFPLPFSAASMWSSSLLKYVLWTLGQERKSWQYSFQSYPEVITKMGPPAKKHHRKKKIHASSNVKFWLHSYRIFWWKQKNNLICSYLLGCPPQCLKVNRFVQLISSWITLLTGSDLYFGWGGYKT